MPKLPKMRAALSLTALVIVGLTLLSCTAHDSDRPCDVGRAAALRGDSGGAIALWEATASDQTLKEKGRAVITCLRNSGLAHSNGEAARWIIDIASKHGGRADLYAGMIYVSGVGVPVDLAKAREYAERARTVAPLESAEILKALDAAEGMSSKPSESSKER